MLSLGLLFILAAAAPQANAVAQPTHANTCYTMRSYRFHQHDGRAPVPAGMITCTPANVLQQRRVSRDENRLFMPLTFNGAEKAAEPKSEQKNK